MQFLALANEVMPQRERDGVRGHDRERSRFRCHIENASFATMNVDEIRPRDLRAWLRDMSQKDALGPGPKRKLTRQSISRSLSLVSAVFVEAVERDIIEINPCLGVKSKKSVGESDTREKWAFLSVDEQRLLFACDAIPYEDRLMMRISIGTGMRQGEFRHLEIPDFVTDGAEPHVLVRIAGRRKTGEKLPPKSGKRRKVPLFGDALVAAREWMAQLEAYAPHNPEGLVFPTRSGTLRQQGKPLGKSATVRQYYALAGIKLRPRLHWHAQRHTFASNLVSGAYGRKWPLPEIQKVMGHSSVTITERYAHLGEDVIAEAVRETIAAAATMAVVEVEPASTAIVVRESEPVRVVEERSILKRIAGRLFGDRKEVSHVA